MVIEYKKTDAPVEEFSLRKSAVFNLPNRITLSRLLLAIVFFVLLSHRYFNVALVIFLLQLLRIGWMGILPESGTYQQTLDV
jgi:hypothetical protein